MTTNNDAELSRLWLACFDGEEAPVPFIEPIARDDVVRLLVGVDAVRAVTWMTDDESFTVSRLMLHLLHYGSPAQRAEATAVQLHDAELAIARLCELVHPILH